MNALEQSSLAYFVNAAWQLPLIALLAIAVNCILRGAPASLRYGIWLAAAGFAALLPCVAILTNLFAPHVAISGPVARSLPTPAARVALMLCVAVSAIRLSRVARATFAAHRLRRAAIRFPGIESPHPVPVLLSPPELESAGPLLIGLRRPAILLPRFFAAPSHAVLRQAALAHEMAHIRRLDLWTLLLSELLLAPLAWHPVTAWLRRKLDEARELACDERAAQSAGSRTAYARALLDIAVHITGRSAPPLQALGIGDGSSLETRIRALAARPAARPACWIAAIAVLTAAAGSIALARFGTAVDARLSALPSPTIAGRPVASFVPAPPPPPPPPRRR